MKRIKKKTKLIAYIVFLLFIFSGIKFAQATCNPQTDTYCLLVPLGNMESVSPNQASFSAYLQQIIDIAIGLTGAIAVIMLIIGGLEYILSSVNEAAKSDAKSRITNAILGLLIALSGYVILNTINPDLLSLGFPQLKSVTTVTSTPPSPEETAYNLCIEKGLAGTGVPSPRQRRIVEDACKSAPDVFDAGPPPLFPF